MLRGYYIHNQKKNASGVTKKIDAQLKVFNKHFDVEEIILSADEESWFARKIRMKILKKRARINYSKALSAIKNPDFVFIRKQILDEDFLVFLRGIRSINPDVNICMEIPTYPYWEEYPKNKVGKKVINEEKTVIPYLKKYVDVVFSYTEATKIFDIDVVNIKNGIEVEANPLVTSEEDDVIDLIAVANFSVAHGYDRLIEGLANYYRSDGKRKIKLYLVGDGEVLSQYIKLIEKNNLWDHIEVCGFKSGKELDEVYNKSDIGISVLASHRIGFINSSALKVGEYVSRGLPVVLAGIDTRYSNKGLDYICQLPNDETPIEVQTIIDFYDQCYANKSALAQRKRIREDAYQIVDMSVVMQPIIDYILNN